MNLPKELTTVTQLSKSLAVILFLAFPFIGFFLGLRYQEMLNFANRQSLETDFITSLAPTPASDETVNPDETANPDLIGANWKTYVNNEYEISFKYPPNFIIENNSKLPQFFFSLKNAEEELVFSVEPSDTPSFASRVKSVESVVKNDIIWIIYPESTYCDAGNCGKTSASYETTKGKLRYAFLLRKVVPNSEILDQILATFQFTE